MHPLCQGVSLKATTQDHAPRMQEHAAAVPSRLPRRPLSHGQTSQDELRPSPGRTDRQKGKPTSPPMKTLVGIREHVTAETTWRREQKQKGDDRCPDTKCTNLASGK